jgi:hypothetical protein
MSGGQHAKEEDVIDEVAHEEDEYINRVMQRKKKPRGNNGVPFVTPNLLIKLVRYCDHSTLLHNMQLTKMTIPLLQILLYILPLIVDDAVDTDFSVMHVAQSALTWMGLARIPVPLPLTAPPLLELQLFHHLDVATL